MEETSKNNETAQLGIGAVMQRNCIKLENKMQIAIHNWYIACKDFGLDKDDIETKMIEVAEKENIELCR